MALNIDKLMSPTAVAKLRAHGLDKIAAALAKQEGFKLAGDAVTAKDVATILGTKLRAKNASYARIHEGIQALRDTK